MVGACYNGGVRYRVRSRLGEVSKEQGCIEGNAVRGRETHVDPHQSSSEVFAAAIIESK